MTDKAVEKEDWVEQAVSNHERNREDERLWQTIVETRLPGCVTLDVLARLYKMEDDAVSTQLLNTLDTIAQDILNAL